MFTEQEKMEQRNKRKKILLIIVSTVAGIFVLFGIVVLILSGINNYVIDKRKENLEKTPSYIYPDPDYDYYIFDDEEYMKLDRRVLASNDGILTMEMTDENYKSNGYSPEMQFMYEIIKLIINGKYDEYNEIFTYDYIRTAGSKLRERFTMQQLYNISIEQIMRGERENIIYTDIKVTYRIRNNNGTFRNDLDYNDDWEIPVVYKLVTSGKYITDIKIADILTERQYWSGYYD